MEDVKLCDLFSDYIYISYLTRFPTFDLNQYREQFLIFRQILIGPMLCWDETGERNQLHFNELTKCQMFKVHWYFSKVNDLKLQ